MQVHVELITYRLRVDRFRRMLPLIMDLKNPAYKPRHWKQIKDTVGQDFDIMSEDFTLNTIAEMQMEDFAEKISEISNAATMELAIEVVSNRDNNTNLNKLSI